MFFKKQLFRSILTVIFVLLMIYANFYIVRRMMQYGFEVYFYDCLLATHQAGSEQKMLDELDRAASDTNMPRKSAMAKELRANIGNIKDVPAFFQNAVTEGTKKVKYLRQMRMATILVLMLILILRFVMAVKDKPPRVK